MRYFKVVAMHVALLLLLILCTGNALADSDCMGTSSSCSFSLNNSGVSGGPFVNVTITLNSKGDATITFTAENGAGIVDGNSLALNVNTNLGWSGGYKNLSSNGESLALDSPGHVDGFGTFNLIFSQHDASTPASKVSVELTGGGWTSASQVLAFNSSSSGSHSSAASHVNVGGCTFFVADGPTLSPASCGSSNVGEPSVYLGLLVSGLIGLFFVPRKNFP